jgi:hypothetical protein
MIVSPLFLNQLKYTTFTLSRSFIFKKFIELILFVPFDIRGSPFFLLSSTLLQIFLRGSATLLKSLFDKLLSPINLIL